LTTVQCERREDKARREVKKKEERRGHVCTLYTAACTQCATVATYYAYQQNATFYQDAYC
jgi:hypothetical protein